MALTAGTLAHRIAKLLKREAPRVMSPKEIAVRLDVPAGSVRKELVRLLERDDAGVVRARPGLYRAFVDAQDLARFEDAPPRLHALQVRLAVPRNRGYSPPGAAPDPANGQYTLDRVWEGRRVVIQVTPRTGVALVSMDSSRDPIAPRDFERWSTWVQGVCEGLGLWWDERQAELVSLELNRDYQNILLDGAKRLRLKHFTKAWAQLYQRAGAMRAEVRVHPELSLKEAVGIIATLQQPPHMPEAPEAPRPSDQEVGWS